MSRRQLLVTAVKARLDAISGVTVHEWLARELAKDELPAHNVRDLECAPHYADGTDPLAPEARHEYRLRFCVDILFDEGDATVTDARAGLAAVRAAIGSDPTWKDEDEEELAAATVLVEERVVADDKGNWIGGARIEFLIVYYAEAWGED